MNHQTAGPASTKAHIRGMEGFNSVRLWGERSLSFHRGGRRFADEGSIIGWSGAIQLRKGKKSRSWPQSQPKTHQGNRASGGAGVEEPDPCTSSFSYRRGKELFDGTL